MLTAILFVFVVNICVGQSYILYNHSATPSPYSSLSPAHSEIREAIVISTAVDAEKEAQDLYDKALKQYGSYGASARNICFTWELRGCQCMGSVEELMLSCDNAGLREVPDELPVDIVKL